MIQQLTALERLYDRSARLLNGCLIWTANVDTRGYGYLKVNYKGLKVHRLMYQYHHGEIPKGVIIKQVCENKLCIEPVHLISETPEQRFWSYVQRGPKDQCWPWLKSKKNGYGRFSFNKKQHYAHRLVTNFPSAEEVKQTCMNKLCCNPNHLKPKRVM